MRIAQLRQADLNLLVVFTALAEERNVTLAAKRLSLSQSAMSRALQRLRDMFHDDLLIRTPTGYDLTPQGVRLLRELEVMLPKLDRLLSGTEFDPMTEGANFRLSSTDYAAHVICPLLCRYFKAETSKVSFEFSAWHDDVFNAMERGRLDLVLNADDGGVSSQFTREMLFREEFVCVVAKASRFAKRMKIDQYLAASHIGISTLGGLQTIPEKYLAEAGVKRHCVIRLPYFAAAIHSIEGTNLVVTVPRRIAESVVNHPGLKIIEAPPLIGGFDYQMVWHPRMNTDAAHVWLRQAIRETGRRIAGKL
ncbi:MAG: LysR family transcriptional regulator [Akkermansiaceae bacterium]|nr:LysR family transcriptional regulator [Akkermansiaceae bacterium]